LGRRQTKAEPPISELGRAVHTLAFIE
jgi:hypothetical protein